MSIIKKDMWDGRAAVAIEPGPFLENPGSEQRDTHQAKFWDWDNSRKN